MRGAWAVCKREFTGYFLTPVGYAVVGMFAAISGIAFTLSLLAYAKMSVNPTAFGYNSTPDFAETLLSPYLVFCGLLIMFLSPLITMRLFAEEKHRGTIELLLTYPLRDRDIVLGKYFAACGMVAVMLPVIGVHLVLVARFAHFEPAALWFGLLTVLLMGAAFISLGLFLSALSRNQITAATLAFGVNLLLYIGGNLGERLPEGNPSPTAWPEWLRLVLGRMYALLRGLALELPLDAHAKDMAQGIVRPADIAYYLLFSAFFLFLTLRALESRNWRA